tara:strand:- start:26 stop:1330 length:1305 start_codon:yes stop_codon:yes gene_type:complete
MSIYNISNFPYMGKDYGPNPNMAYTQVMPASGMEYIYDQTGTRYSVPMGRDNLFFYDSQNFSPFDFYKNYGVSGAEPITGDGKDLTQPVNAGIDAIRESNPYNFKDSGIMSANNVAAFEQATQDRISRLRNPGKIAEFFYDKIPGMRPQTLGDVMREGYQKPGVTLPSLAGILASVLPSSFDNMTRGEQAFTYSQMGYTDPRTNMGNKDAYGYNVVSAFGNYADLVDKRAKIAEDFFKKRGYYRPIDQYYLNQKRKKTDMISDMGLVNKALEQEDIVSQKIKEQFREKQRIEAEIARKEKEAAEARRIAELSRRQTIVDAQKATTGFTTSGGAGNYRSDRDHSGAGGYGGTGRASREARSTDLGFSDIRLKENVELIGKSPSNINIYKFNYKNIPTTYQGAMAHEVPWASVKHDNGYMMIDYSKIDVELKEWQK